jgi:hypothetical protein
VFAASIIAGDNIPNSDDAVADRALISTCAELTAKLGGAWPNKYERAVDA